MNSVIANAVAPTPVNVKPRYPRGRGVGDDRADHDAGHSQDDRTTPLVTRGHVDDVGRSQDGEQQDHAGVEQAEVEAPICHKMPRDQDPSDLGSRFVARPSYRAVGPIANFASAIAAKPASEGDRGPQGDTGTPGERAMPP